MRFVLDANLSPGIVQDLTGGRIRDRARRRSGMLAAPDAKILERCEADGSVLVTANTDFPMLVALRRATSPSIVLMRGVAELPPSTHAELLVSNLPSVIDDLVRGAIVTITPRRVRVRDLPIQ